MTDGKSMNWRLAARSALFLCLAGCATMGNDTGEPTQLLPLIDPPAQAGAPDLFIAMPTSINFAEVRKSLVSELRRNFNIHTFAVGPETKATDLGAAFFRWGLSVRKAAFARASFGSDFKTPAHWSRASSYLASFS